jgi:NAD(P)-dependent dehydrogenase (short-subunit alcohol dehydrogenase family)
MKKPQTVLITGATSGIGLAIASKLHDQGFEVFGTSRFASRQADNFPFELLQMDVTSQDSIDRCINDLFSRIDVLDILIANAGTMLSGNVEETPVNQARRQFDTNFWGAVRVTKAVLPHMRAERTGKIIAISSVVGLFGVPFSSYYSASKHAMEGFFKSLRFELCKFNVHVSVVQPGFFKTNIAHSLDYVHGKIPDYAVLEEHMSRFFNESIANAPTPEPVANVVLKIINSKSPRYNYPVGSGSKILPLMQFISYSFFEKAFMKNANFK